MGAHSEKVWVCKPRTRPCWPPDLGTSQPTLPHKPIPLLSLPLPVCVCGEPWLIQTVVLRSGVLLEQIPEDVEAALVLVPG